MSFVAKYTITSGQAIEVVIEQPDGGKAIVVGTLDWVTDVAAGRALRIVVVGSRIVALPPE
jgi:hypothetical protein